MTNQEYYELLIEMEKLLCLMPKENRSQNWGNYYWQIQDEISHLMDLLNITGNDLY